MTIRSMAMHGVNLWGNNQSVGNHFTLNLQGRSAPRRGDNIAPTSPDFQASLLNVRQAADSMRATIDNMRGASSNFGMIQPVSGDEDMLRITSADANRLRNAQPGDFSVDIVQLAEAQRNEGAALTASDLATDAGFDVGNHHIALNVGGRQFDVNFAVSATDTARDVQQRIAHAVNARASATGVTASVDYDRDTGLSSLILESTRTGVDRAGQPNFTVTSDTGNALEVIGVEDITQQAQNAQFRVNRGSITGALRESRTNDVDLGHGITAQLRDVGQVQVTMGRDVDGQVGNIRSFVDSFNSFLEAARGGASGAGNRLERDLTRLTEAFSATLQRVGINRDDSGFLRIDESRMAAAAESGVLERFAHDGGNRGTFGMINRIGRMADNVSRNPMPFMNNRGFNTQNQRPFPANFMPNMHTNTGILFESMM